jgi:hypothetical protein
VLRALALLVGLAGCSAGSATYPLAVGWSGSLPSWRGPCDGATLKPTGILEEPARGSFIARRAGVAEVRCRDGKLQVIVRRPDRITIEQLGPLSLHRTHILNARVADAKGSLDIGDTQVEWTFPPQLREITRCNHMFGTCLSGESARVVAEAPGDAQVIARYGSLTTSATFRIE